MSCLPCTALRVFTQARVPATRTFQQLRQCQPVSSPLRELQSVQRGASAPSLQSRLLHTTTSRKNAVESNTNTEPHVAQQAEAEAEGGDQHASSGAVPPTTAEMADGQSETPDGEKPRKKKARWSEEKKQTARAAREAQMKSKQTQAKSDKTEAGEGRDTEEKPTKPLSIQEKAMASKELTRKTDWKTQKMALKEKFPDGWQPKKKLSPDAVTGIKALHAQFPETYTTEVLANKFEVSPEAIRRILKSKWTPSPEEEIERQERWHNRGKNVWKRWAEMGKKPPRRWRAEGIVRDPKWNEKRPAGNHPAAIAHQKLSQSLM